MCVSTVASLSVCCFDQETLPILLLSVVGSAVFIGLLLCVRRFDAEQGDEGNGRGGGEVAMGRVRIARRPARRTRASAGRDSREPTDADSRAEPDEEKKAPLSLTTS